MSKTIRLHFDPSQPHQLRAIESTVKLFEELPINTPEALRRSLADTGLGFDDVEANFPAHAELSEEWLLENLNAVRAGQDLWLPASQMLPQTQSLDMDDGEMLDVEGCRHESHRYPEFTVEMETGTGKTYVYLRTIQELHKNFGFRKFIIVVPSVAIYEGVVKSVEDLREHFGALYGKNVAQLIKYDGQYIGRLREFATSPDLQVLLMTMASFNTTGRNLYSRTEKLQGEWLPYQYIQAVRPILILDESQNYRQEASRRGLRTLKPLFALNYSATPDKRDSGGILRKASNKCYRLGPMEAFQQGLVKKIEVVGVTEQYQYNDEQLQFSFVNTPRRGYGPSVQTELTCIVNGEPVRQPIVLTAGESLFNKTKNPKFQDLVVRTVDQRLGLVIFENGDQVNVQDTGGLDQREYVFRTQIEETIRYHFAKQKQLLERGVKVLSLFFIDRVDSYRGDDALVRRIFDESFDRLKTDDPHWSAQSASEVREGYFAVKKAKGKADEYIDTNIEKKTDADNKAEKLAYELIMKGRSRLLNFDEKVCFIFAHSALKEGWDNPNVFQICTLNRINAENRKRQEIGRGLRLCVDQNGQRVMDDQVNVLTVVANESYEKFVGTLQKEYREDGHTAPPNPSQAKPVYSKRRNKLFRSPEFKRFWDKLMQKAEYEIDLHANEIIDACVAKLNIEHFPEPHVIVSKGRYVMTNVRIELQEVTVGSAKFDISITDSDNVSRSITNKWFRAGNDLSRKLKQPLLKGFKLVEVSEDADGHVVFGNGDTIAVGSFIVRDAQEQLNDATAVHLGHQSRYPVFNLIDRAAQETNLTRKTILTIFQRMRTDQKERIFRNPEGFSGLFIRAIREVLANHVAERLQYHLVEGTRALDIDQLFPAEKKYPQKELIAGSSASMYDQVQVDSDVEQRFVEQRLNPDNKVKLYLKFPAGFKITMPKIIHDYNPDWGVLREDEKKAELLLELVRETKGTVNLQQLRFPHEIRKIIVAKKYFKKLGLDYRPVTDAIPNWWQKDPQP